MMVVLTFIRLGCGMRSARLAGGAAGDGPAAATHRRAQRESGNLPRASWSLDGYTADQRCDLALPGQGITT
jgi:hypothetical protein